MKLINIKSGCVVKPGEQIMDNTGEWWMTDQYTVGQPPQHVGSTGRVFVQANDLDDPNREFFPSVFGLKWVEDDYVSN